MGIDEPVYQGGALVGTRRFFSDTLAIFLLKAHRLEKYRERYGVKDDRPPEEGKIPDAAAAAAVIERFLGEVGWQEGSDGEDTCGQTGGG